MALSEKAREILNRPDLIKKRDSWFARMEKVFGGEYTGWNSQYVLGVDGVVSHIPYDPAVPAKVRVEAALETAAQNCTALENEAYFRPVCVEYPPFGVHYIDKLLGAEVSFYAGQWYNKYMTTPIGSLKMPALEEDPLWQDSMRVAEVKFTWREGSLSRMMDPITAPTPESMESQPIHSTPTRRTSR